MKLCVPGDEGIFSKLNSQQLLITEKAISMDPNANTKTKIPLSIKNSIVKLSLPKPLQEIQDWLTQPIGKRGSSILKRNKKKAVLLNGSGKSGKYSIATMIATQSKKELYKVDLSKLVSKYIGETEKNLSKVFELARKNEWILFFDETDALFGKRTTIKDSHDRYANQEVSYLLQKIDEHEGLVFLSSNLKKNIDDAFIRRFNAVITFPLP